MHTLLAGQALPSCDHAQQFKSSFSSHPVPANTEGPRAHFPSAALFTTATRCHSWGPFICSCWINGFLLAFDLNCLPIAIGGAAHLFPTPESTLSHCFQRPAMDKLSCANDIMKNPKNGLDGPCAWEVLEQVSVTLDQATVTYESRT